MPPRSSIDPADIPELLPHLGIIENADGQFRYRLIGTTLAKQLGCDVTGGLVGSYVPAGQALRDTVALVCTAAQPVFNTASYDAPNLAHNSSVVLLPLSEDGAEVNMVIFLRIVRSEPYVWASRDWLRTMPVTIGEPVQVQHAAHLERLIADWERICPAPVAKEAVCQER